MAHAPESFLEENYERERGKPMPSFNHGIAQANLIFALNLACRDRFSIASELSLASEPPMTPDVSVCNMRQPDWLHDEPLLAEPPVAAVEIISPFESVDDRIPKIESLFEFGVQSVWLVQPPLKQVAVFTPDMEPQVYSDSEVVDPALGVKIALKEIFS
jgi:Uma2 family endonuclease